MMKLLKMFKKFPFYDNESIRRQRDMMTHSPDEDINEEGLGELEETTEVVHDPDPPPQTTSKLLITLTNGMTRGWISAPFDAKYSWWHPWRQFQKWYFCRPQSEVFSFRYDSGETIIRRSDIFIAEVMTIKQPPDEDKKPC